MYEEASKNGLSLRFFPVLFTMHFEAQVTCIEVGARHLHVSNLVLVLSSNDPTLSPHAPMLRWYVSPMAGASEGLAAHGRGLLRT